MAESIFEAEFGLGLDPETLEMGIGGGFMEVITADGDVYEIDLDAAGYLDDIESFLGVASDDPNFAELALNGTWFTATGYAWFSPDGQTWTELDGSGPFDGGQIGDVVATSDGFVATSEGSGFSPAGPAQSVLWETTDGTTWTEKSTLNESHLTPRSGLDEWNGRLVAVTGIGVWTIEETPQHLFRAALGVMEIGEFGLIGVPSEVDGGGTEVLFSKDGTTWNRWIPPEFGPEGLIYVKGIGDDFVVLTLIRSEPTLTASSWVGRLP